MFESSPRKCEYGCGREARHLFKNGKWCCSKYVTKCPSIRKEISKSLKEFNRFKKQRKINEMRKRTIEDCGFFETE